MRKLLDHVLGLKFDQEMVYYEITNLFKFWKIIV